MLLVSKKSDPSSKLKLGTFEVGLDLPVANVAKLSINRQIFMRKCNSLGIFALHCSRHKQLPLVSIAL